MSVGELSFTGFGRNLIQSSLHVLVRRFDRARLAVEAVARGNVELVVFVVPMVVGFWVEMWLKIITFRQI